MVTTLAQIKEYQRLINRTKRDRKIAASRTPIQQMHNQSVTKATQILMPISIKYFLRPRRTRPTILSLCNKTQSSSQNSIPLEQNSQRPAMLLSITIRHQLWDTIPLLMSATRIKCNIKVSMIKISKRRPNWLKSKRKLDYILNFPQAGHLSRIVTSSIHLQVSYHSSMSVPIWATSLPIRQDDRQEIVTNAGLTFHLKELHISLKRLRSIESPECKI